MWVVPKIPGEENGDACYIIYCTWCSINLGYESIIAGQMVGFKVRGSCYNCYILNFQRKRSQAFFQEIPWASHLYTVPGPSLTQKHMKQLALMTKQTKHNLQGWS